MQLRPYQTQLVTEIRGQYQLGHKAVLAVLPTGGGKTVCFSPYRPSRQRQGQSGADPWSTALSYWIKPAVQCQCRMASLQLTAPWT
jgi:hypothetical protein